MKTQPKNINTEVVITELHKAFAIFNKEFFNGELKEPAILIQSKGNRKGCLGWCTVNKAWRNQETKEERYEVNIVAEGLNRGVYPVMGTLIHEMVHLYCLQNDIRDVSRGGTYHNKRFKEVAERSGLVIEHDERIGWSLTKLQSGTMSLIDKSDINKEAFNLSRKDGVVTSKEPSKKSSVRKYVCPNCGCIIRATKKVNVICGDCLEAGYGVFQFVDADAPVKKPAQPVEEPVQPVVGPVAEPVVANPVEEPAEETVKYICTGCGCVHHLAKGSEVCPECGGALAEPIEAKPENSKLITWNVQLIRQVLEVTAEQSEAVGLKPCSFEDVNIVISDKMNTQWAKYTEGENIKIQFSKHYLDTASDVDVTDTIRHQYIHHYQYVTEGLKPNHKKEFKALCDLIGVSKEVPSKSHKPVK